MIIPTITGEAVTAVVEFPAVDGIFGRMLVFTVQMNKIQISEQAQYSNQK